MRDIWRGGDGLREDPGLDSVVRMVGPPKAILLAPVWFGSVPLVRSGPVRSGPGQRVL